MRGLLARLRRGPRCAGAPRGGATPPGDELPPGRYELRYTYDPNTTLGEADVLARADDVRDLADRFAECGAPYKQVVFAFDDGTADWLDELENQVLVDACAKRGLQLEERDYGEGVA
jgi:hypothetical protein